MPRLIDQIFEELQRITGEPYNEELQFGGPAEQTYLASLPPDERELLINFLDDRADTIRRRDFETVRLYYAAFDEIQTFLDDRNIPPIERATFLEMYLFMRRQSGGLLLSKSLSTGEVLTVEQKALTSMQARLLDARLQSLIDEYAGRRRTEQAGSEVAIILRHAETIPSLSDRLRFLKVARMNFDKSHPGPASGMAVDSEWRAYRELNAVIDLITTAQEHRNELSGTEQSIPASNGSQEIKSPLLQDLSSEPRFTTIRAFLESLDRDATGRFIWNHVQGDLPLLMYHIWQARALPYTKDTHLYTCRCFVWPDRKDIDPKDLSRKLANMDRGRGGRQPGDVVAGLIRSLSLPTTTNTKPT